MDTSEVSLAVAALSVVVAISSAIWSFFSWREAKASRDQQRMLAQAARNTAFESKLAEWPEAMAFYGIDQNQAQKEGISEKQIAFLVLAVNALTLDADLKGTDVTKQIRSSYWVRLFSSEVTKRTWKYSRNCISDNWRAEIDRFLNSEAQATSG